MSLIKRNGAAAPNFPAIFDDFFSRDFFNWNNSNFSSTSTTVPHVNIIENNDGFQVEMAAPGMDKNDFKIELKGNQLTISSVKENSNEKNTGNYSHREFSYQSFQRTFALPADVVNAAEINAKYENGLLHVSIPKKEEAKQTSPRLIEIH